MKPSSIIRRLRWGRVLLILGLLAAIAWLAVGCTVAPRYVETPAAASFDGNERNSGFLAFNEDGSGVITPRARDRYNALVAKYGKDNLPKLKKDFGVSKRDDGNYNITAEALVAFGVMNKKNRSGILPK